MYVCANATTLQIPCTCYLVIKLILSYLIKRCGWTVLRLTTRPRPARYGWTCQELPPTGIAQGVIRVHKPRYHDKITANKEEMNLLRPFICAAPPTSRMIHGRFTLQRCHLVEYFCHVIVISFLGLSMDKHRRSEWEKQC